MDLLSEIGDKDQLIFARENEIKVLRSQVEELKEKVKSLTVDNAALLAEVEMYRKKAALPTFSALSEIIDSENVTTETKDDARNSKREPKVLVHELKSIPPYKKFRGAELVSAAGRYNQRLCSLCGGKKIRTYCICTPGTFRCRNCYDEHIIECNNQLLGCGMINNENVTTDTKDDEGKRRREPKVLVHDLKSIPPYKKFRGTELVSAAGRYNQRLCSLCAKKRVRTYCICTPGTFRCRNCYDEHIIECNNQFATSC